MSFLAQLRKQQPGLSANHSQLSFLFDFERQKVLLRLALIATEQGQFKCYVSDYRIQRQHLLAPPPFYSADDSAILSRILGCHPSWDGISALDCSVDFGDEVFIDIIRTGKAFAQFDGGWRNLFIGPSSVGRLHWHITGQGDQYLFWLSRAHTRVATLAQAVYSVNEFGEIARIEHPILLGDQRSFLGVCLRSDEVHAWLDNHAQGWTTMALPLPLNLPRRQDNSASLSAALECWSHEGRSWAQLVYRYQGKHFCIAHRADDSVAPIRLWDGLELWQIDPDHRLQQRIYHQCESYLAGFEQTGEKGKWLCDTPAPWQRLLTEHKAPLAALGIELVVQQGFYHNYMQADSWDVHVQGEGTAMVLQLSCSAGQQRFDVFGLLPQIDNMRGTVVDGQCQFAVDGGTLLLPEKLCGILCEEFADLIAWQKLHGPIPLNQMYRLTTLDGCLPDANWHGDEQLLARAQALNQAPTAVDIRRCRVQATLRSYQWLGVSWIQHIKALGLNGLLADDMGLGKTLQTIAHLSLEFQADGQRRPALIVVPTSLLSNWANELQKFCPQLSLAVIHGSDRHSIWDKLNEFNVLITSYQLVVNDQDRWREQPLSWLVLDEAQVIKNPRTRVSQAVKTIAADHRLCLSGTPVENHLAELWSVVDFLVPGLLGTLRQFREYYQKPIEQERNSERMGQLLKRVAPIMLRRTKTQVADDLPKKTLIPVSIAFDDEQAALYDQIKQEGWRQLEETLASDIPEGQKQIRLLTAITRLRQVCCDPRLLGESQVPSAKTQACVNMVEELVQEGRSVLIFSQFTRMLALIAQELQNLGIAYFMLTGSTRNRAQLVEAFQRGDRPVFLISLKAGGVGLNLTRADTVIHFDPWWNLAAEQQASDRAHRIGQTQPVFVYKLLVANTIEDKIAQLQSAKASLSGHVERQAQYSGEHYALKFHDLVQLWKDED